MEIDDIKNLLQEAKNDPSTLDQAQDFVDKLLGEVIRIEKRHLYGLETTSVKKRRDEINKFLLGQLEKKEGS
jgi:hypothetical protein